jgi:hypothetical protein
VCARKLALVVGGFEARWQCWTFFVHVSWVFLRVQASSAIKEESALETRSTQAALKSGRQKTSTLSAAMVQSANS